MNTSRQLRVVADGFAYLEAPRWHDGALWCAHWGADEILRLGPDGTCEVVAPGPAGLGWAFSWLPDGRLVTTGEALLRHEEDGTRVVHADLRGLTGAGSGTPGASDEILIDPRGNAYVNSIEFDFLGGSAPDGGIIVLVEPDGSARQVAEGLAFPNGMAITPDGATLIVAESFGSRLTAFDIASDGGLVDRRTWAQVDGSPDGICLDADGAVWFADVPNRRCVRVREGGRVLDEVHADRACFACALGGEDRRTLFVLTAEWDDPANIDANLARRSGQICAIDVDIPGVGWP